MADNIKYGFGKYIWIIGVITLLGGGSFFAYLESIGLEIECEDKVCEQGIECNIDCSVRNPTYTSKYIFNHGNWPITFTPEIEEFELYAKYHGKWRFTNFTKETRFTNIPDSAKYVFVFPRRTTKYFQVRVTLNSTQRIKYNFGELDPLIQGYEYIYKNKSRPITNDTKVCTPTIDAKNISHTEDCITEITYKTEYYEEKESILDRKGIKVNGEFKEGWWSLCEDGYLVERTVNPGDLNEEEFCRCQPHTLQKKVCKETDLFK